MAHFLVDWSQSEKDQATFTSVLFLELGPSEILYSFRINLNVLESSQVRHSTNKKLVDNFFCNHGILERL